MRASSHMGPRGCRVSLAQTAAKEDYIRGLHHRATVDEYCATVERVKAKHGTTPPPPRPRKGGLLPNVVYTAVCR